ncbi:MAG: hypothetical protein KDC19_14660, partial [Saprospiraceae bacterium]|nr:hypothetical protein [Saprospiraceae bacterium]
MTSPTTGTVTGITANLVEIRPEGPVLQNEMCQVQAGDASLLGEVIKVTGDTAFVQVFDSTRGLTVGSPVIFSGQRLVVQLGPGILSKKYDGLQNDLDKFEGIFLQRGLRSEPLDPDHRWSFVPLATVGDPIRAGDW